jgi:nascent polypeptide-associated complex subunit beta
VRDNLYVITGAPEIKELRDLMPGIIPQLGAQNMDFLRQFAEMAKQAEEKDEDIPDLVENFDEVAES